MRGRPGQKINTNKFQERNNGGGCGEHIQRGNHEKSPQNAGHEEDNAHEVELVTAPQSRIVQAQNNGAEGSLLEGVREVSCHIQRIKIKMALNRLAALELKDNGAIPLKL